MRVFLFLSGFLITVCHSWHHKGVELDTKFDKVKKEILDTHNKLRASVDPPAANMLVMTWDDEAAKEAQKLADSCVFDHNKYKHSIFSTNGQNLAYSTYFRWSDAIQAWFDEVKDFTYGSTEVYNKKIGHYTQLVWATSHKVGCAATHCSFGDYFVCNYHPAGNRNRHKEYPYVEGPFCQDCPNDCSGKLCTNACEEGANLIDNCEQMASSLPCPNNYCMASCKCTNKITWKFPYDNMKKGHKTSPKKTPIHHGPVKQAPRPAAPQMTAPQNTGQQTVSHKLVTSFNGKDYTLTDNGVEVFTGSYAGVKAYIENLQKKMSKKVKIVSNNTNNMQEVYEDDILVFRGPADKVKEYLNQEYGY